MIDLTELYTLSTSDLIRIAHIVASLLRERAGHAQETAVIDEADHKFCQALVEAGPRGVSIGGLRAVLVPGPM